MTNDTLRSSEMSIAIEIRDVYGKPTAYPLDVAAKHFASIAGTKTITQATLIHVLGLGFAIVELYRGDVVRIWRATDLHPMCTRVIVMQLQLKPIKTPSEYATSGDPYDCTGLIGELGSDAQWPMWSYSRPGSILWNSIAASLHQRGWSDEEIETRLASKNARWALDGQLGDWLQALGREFAKSIDKSQIADCLD